jgi:hypothetical protein
MIIGRRFFTPKVPVGVSKSFTTYGKSFFKLNGVFLSGGVFENQTFFNPFSASPRLSAAYPGFSAIELSATQYTYNNNNELTFTMPSASYEGFADVILLNEAGWGTLTQFVVKNPGNPFFEGSANYNNYTPYQRPWKDGIIVGDGNPNVTFTPELSVTFVLSLTSDSDYDGYTDVEELSAGTDPNDTNSFPSSLFNVFNNI